MDLQGGAAASVALWGVGVRVPAGGQGPWVLSQVQRVGWSACEVAFHTHHGGIESTCNAGAADLIPGSGRALGGGNGNPLQYPCLETPMDGEAWRATVQGVSKCWTRPSEQQAHISLPLSLDLQQGAEPGNGVTLTHILFPYVTMAGTMFPCVFGP